MEGIPDEDVIIGVNVIVDLFAKLSVETRNSILPLLSTDAIRTSPTSLTRSDSITDIDIIDNNHLFVSDGA